MFHVKHYPGGLWGPNRLLFGFLVLLLVAAVGITGCVVSENPVTGRKRALGYTWQQEVQLGREADPQIIAQYGVYDNQELTNYVTRIGQQVLQESHLRREDTAAEFRNTEFTFRVMDSPVVNAFALPGGYVYVTRGLLAHLENEAQLAMVLGHEVAHVAARHASQRAFEAQASQLGIIAGAVLGQQVLGGSAAENILNMGGQATQLLLLSHSRDDEREADELGVEYAALSHYAAGEGAGFFSALERISAQQAQGLPSFLATHPDPGEREQTIQQLAARWQDRVQMEEVDRDTYLNMIDGLVVGENPRQGYVQNSQFYHPDLRFQFPVPQGFQVQNQPTQVAMVAPNQDAVMVFSTAESNSAQQAASELAGQEGIQVIEQGAARSNGNPAYYLLAEAQTQQGGNVRLLYYAIEYQGDVWYFLGYSTPQAFNSYQDVFLRSMRGFNSLSDQRFLNVQPTRLQTTTASRTAPFRSFIPANLPADMTAEELAIMNQVQLDDTIQQGTRIKLPQ